MVVILQGEEMGEECKDVLRKMRARKAFGWSIFIILG